MKFVTTALAGAVTIAFAQFATAEAPRVVAPHSVNIEQQGAQNSTQYGSGNQSSQVYGSGNQSTTMQGDQNQSVQQQGSGNTGSNTYQRGAQNQNATGSGNQQNQQYGAGNQSSQGGTSGSHNEHNRQSNMPYGQRDAQNQHAQGSGNQQNQQYGYGNRSEQHGPNASGGASRDDDRHDKGKHKGWYKDRDDERRGSGD